MGKRVLRLKFFYYERHGDSSVGEKINSFVLFIAHEICLLCWKWGTNNC